MRKHIIFTIFLTFFSFFSYVYGQQEKYIKHTVSNGETINSIAQKYKVTPFDIYKLNPDSQNGIQENIVLLIPSSAISKINTDNKKGTTHLVQPKETLFSISKQYGVSVDDIKVANSDLSFDTMKIGQKIKIPTNGVQKDENFINTKSSKNDNANEDGQFHIIESKESKYGISKKYGISIEELERLNPIIASEFPIGYKLVISENKINQNSISSSESTSVSALKTESVKPATNNSEEHIVLLKETLYSIASTYNMTVDELILLNPELKNGLKAGMKLRFTILNSKEKGKKQKINLSNTIKVTNTKKLAILLPFNLIDIENDSLPSIQPNVKKTKLLNMALDFYSGALMAIDSAKVLDLDIVIKILDSQETKTTSNVGKSIAENDLQNMDAIIGPFYQANVETLAQLLSNTKTPVISPLSKELGVNFPNLYQSTPTSDFLRNAIFDYIKSKRGNVIAIIDNNQTLKNYIYDNEPSFSLAGFNEDGIFEAESFISKFDKNKINYVVLDSENKTIIDAVGIAMLAAQNEYQVQLVILGQNDNSNFNDASLKRLAKLKPLFPSLTKPNYTKEAINFVRKYKIKYKVNPNKYAIRGFDVTFDTLLRLAQDKSFEQTIQESNTEQIENRFFYEKNEAKGYCNTGIYILYFDADSILKSVL